MCLATAWPPCLDIRPDSAHILGQALERAFHGHLCTGPPIEGGGFFYDIRMAGRTVGQADFPVLQALVDDVIKVSASQT